MEREQREELFLVNHSSRADAAKRHARWPGATRADKLAARELIDLRDFSRRQVARDADDFSMTLHNVLVAWKPA